MNTDKEKRISRRGTQKDADEIRFDDEMYVVVWRVGVNISLHTELGRFL